jgi:two-component system response regulator MprA
MSRRILVVDDDDAMVRTLCDILRTRGWEPDGAHSGEEAVAIVCADGYTNVLMDIRMPGMDGVAACKTMKNCGRSPAPRVVLMTAHTAPELLDAARRDGTHVVTKPIDMPALLEYLQ